MRGPGGMLMPRPGPRRPLIALRLGTDGLAHIHQRAVNETDGNQSEMIRRMLAYATTHMPRGWVPSAPSEFGN